MRAVRFVVAVCAAMLLLPALAMAQPTTTNVMVGQGPWGVAIDSSSSSALNNTAFVTNYYSDTVSVFPVGPGGTTHNPAIAVGSEPEGVAVDPDTDMIYVANFGSDNVTVINGNNWTTSLITLPAGANLNPNSVAVDPVTNTVYVGTYMSSRVDVIQGATSTTPAAFMYGLLIAGANIHDVVVNPTDGVVYASAYNLNEVYEITPSSPYTVSSVAAGCAPDGMAVDPDAATYESLWYADNASCGSPLNTPAGVQRFETVGMWAPPNSVGYAGEAVSQSAPAFLTLVPGLADAFASVPSSNSVEAVNDVGVLQTVSVGPNPRMLDVDLNDDDIVVANYGSDYVTVIQGLAP
jgi:DNA-binding beta-propeller fold protein YncE